MSKSLRRVISDAESRGVPISPVQLDASTRTAQDAADAVGATVDQIVKSVILRALGSDEHVLFLTAGSNFVDDAKAAAVAGVPLEKADGNSIRAVTGFAIGGVSPFGHLTPIRAYFDPHILSFDTVWAAAGTPNHVFSIAPKTLLDATGATVADFTR
ncbi:YbaK/EbsC family protein [Halovulum dunhuangense]|uniref:YbaK/EbsC family protein n=1 Tax=Halovulum dunhuangense TaxID=1505036 RepID=A0A849L370_9RHOB|nr:YbaK/EbsC family protein [Halovulum dunhuangense]NNU80703.1 YbaK/EbsC family protein [Halovulum dunhuangense]